MDYDSTLDTTAHINRVRFLLGQCAIRLLERGSRHDASKLEQPEKSTFDAVGNRLPVITYGGKEYRQSLAELKVALDHHYLHNSHHPEHYPNGIDGMSLFDLIEMLMDWKAASERHPGEMNIARSIEVSSQRFSVGEQLEQIFVNTAKEIGWISD
jgi:Family of unknown function (DUF5662)